MAKLRQNHTKSGKRPFAGLTLRVILFFVIISALFIFAYQMFDNAGDDSDIAQVEEINSTNGELLIPKGNQGEVVVHDYYSLGYNEDHEQADWVSYELTKESLRIPNVPRSDWFDEDNKVSTRSAKHRDYSGSGYSRGHMAPAGDMAFSAEAMETSFLMSNMTPQISGFNGGIWRELEESVRDWAYKNEQLYIATGPIFNNVTKYIGKQSKIRVPSHFYKIVIDVASSSEKGIAFIIPHKVIDVPLTEFAVSIDEVEAMTNLDFFDNLYSSVNEEERVEATYNMNLWSLSKKRFQNRINNWNNN